MRISRDDPVTKSNACPFHLTIRIARYPASAASLAPCTGSDAGWSSPVARQAHNLKAAGSNPAPATTDTDKPAASAAGFVFLPVFPIAWRSVHSRMVRRSPCSAANILAGRIKAKLRQYRAPATRPDGRKTPVIDTLKWSRTRHAGRPFLPITATKAAKVAHTAAAKKARPFADHSIASPAAMGPRNAPSPHIRPMAA